MAINYEKNNNKFGTILNGEFIRISSPPIYYGSDFWSEQVSSISSSLVVLLG
jgi:hypothetical protein